MKCGTRFAALTIGTVAGLSLTSGCETPGDDGAAADDGSRRGELIVYQADNFETGASVGRARG